MWRKRCGERVTAISGSLSLRERAKHPLARK
jgi:hypothetical protein